MNTRSLRRAQKQHATPSITVHRRLGLEVTQLLDGSGRATLQLCGEMDAISAPLLSAVADRTIEQGVGLICLDLSRLTFCDAAGLHAVTTIHEHLSALQGSLVLIGLRPKTRQLLAITGMDLVLHVDDTPSSARLRTAELTPAVQRTAG